MVKNIKRESFKYNFLKQIIIRLDFQGVLQAEMEDILMKVKPCLKMRKFNRYEQMINDEIDFDTTSNGIFQSNHHVKEIKNIIIHSFINEDRGYSIDLSTTYICLKVNAVKYIPFEEYSDTFIKIARIYKDAIDFFTPKRFGLRKINFCFVTNTDCIHKYFKQRYFDCYDLFDNSEIFASEKRGNFTIDNYKINLLCDIIQGQLGEKKTYKVTLDADIYLDNIKDIEENIFENCHMKKLNDQLFTIYVDALTDEFHEMLLNDETIWPEEIVGVEKNE